MAIRFVIKTLLFLVALIVFGAYYLFCPNYAQVLHYKGQAIKIRRNENNIPYIIAPSRQSFFYGIGRVHAEDRLFQTVFKILVIQGRLSEYLGERPLPMDKFMRELNLHGWGRLSAQRLQAQNQTQFANFKAYASGINQYANSLQILPFDFQLIRYKWQDITVGDIFGLFKLLQWSQSLNIVDQFTRSLLLANYTREQVNKLLPITQQDWAFQSTVTIDDQLISQELRTDYLKDHERFKQFSPEILKYYTELGIFDLFKTAQGSNVWAVSGKHTKSGKPILAHDPHLENCMPSQWYQLQATYFHDGSNHSISGISASGVPFIIGKTDYLALGVTTIYMDNQDLYKEKVQGNKYLVNGKWMDLKIREQKIKVKTSEGIKQETYLVRQTHRGPLLHYIIVSFGSFELHEHISLRWTGFNDEYSSVVLTTHIAEVKNIEHVKQYLLHETEFLFNVNVVFITMDGHIGHQQLGMYPIRQDPSSAHFVKDGTTTDHDWLGFVPAAHRLQTVDPPKGYLINGNNKLANSIYYNGLHNYTIYTARSDRLHSIISELIEKGHKLDVKDAIRIISDTVDSYCQRILPYIIRSIPQSSTVLQNFDCNFAQQSTPAVMYEVFIYELHHLIKAHRLEKVSVLSMHTNAQYLFNFIKKSSEDDSKAVILKTAWSNMRANLNNFFKTNDDKQWKWGKYHKDVMHHLPFTNSPFNFLYDRQYQGSGNMHTVNVGKMNKVEFGNFETSHRANYRAIYSFVEDSFWIIDSGSSEKWFSGFYDDQWKLFQKNQFLTLRNPSSLNDASNTEL